jgi:Flp pilus assembly protein TadD
LTGTERSRTSAERTVTRQAITLEPLRGTLYCWLAIYLAGLHRVDEAEQAIRNAIALQPGASDFHQWLAIIEVQRGDAKAALAAAQQEPPGSWQHVRSARTAARPMRH